jgi:energy-coupling factor transport system permease protein
MTVGLIYLFVAVVGIVLAGIAYFMNRDSAGKIFVAFTLMEIVIMAIVGVINGVLGTPNAMLGRLFMTFSGSYGFLAFAAICGGFYISGPLAGYIIRKPGAATIAETMNGVAQVLSGNPNGVMVLGAGFLQGFMSDSASPSTATRSGRFRCSHCRAPLRRSCSKSPRSISSELATWAFPTTCWRSPSA